MKRYSNKDATVRYLATIEFRYLDEEDDIVGTSRSVTATLGVFDTEKEAVDAGNVAIDEAGEDFVLSIDKTGYVKRDRLDHRSPYGRLVRHWDRKNKGVEYFVKVEPLRFYTVSSIVAETKAAMARYWIQRREKTAINKDT